MADRFFKRPNGDVIKTFDNQDANTLKSWEDRFIECDIDGNELKKESKKKAKKGDK